MKEQPNLISLEKTIVYYYNTVVLTEMSVVEKQQQWTLRRSWRTEDGPILEKIKS